MLLFGRAVANTVQAPARILGLGPSDFTTKTGLKV
jgi:hypothetical protein